MLLDYKIWDPIRSILVENRDVAPEPALAGPTVMKNHDTGF
jgi:hypothetical protein